MFTGHGTALDCQCPPLGIPVFVHNDLLAAGKVIHGYPAGTFVGGIDFFGRFFNFFKSVTQDAQISTILPAEDLVDPAGIFHLMRGKFFEHGVKVPLPLCPQFRSHRPAFIAKTDFYGAVPVNCPIFFDMFFYINISCDCAAYRECRSCKQ